MTNHEAADIVRTFRDVMDTPITEYREELIGALNMAIEALENPRSREKEVDGETPRGYWIKDHIFIKCSLCGAYSLDGTSKSHFCSNCGAVMMKGYLT